jgi:hypothetical protein
MIRIVYILRWLPKKHKASLLFLLLLTLPDCGVKARAIVAESILDYRLIDRMTKETQPVDESNASLSTEGSIKPAVIKTLPLIIPSQPIILPASSTLEEPAGLSQTQVALAALKPIGPSPVSLAYQKRYQELKSIWRSGLHGTSAADTYPLFFQQDDTLNKVDGIHNSVEALSSGELTEKGVQALMLRFLFDTPSIDYPKPSAFDVIPALVDTTSTNSVSINDMFIKERFLMPAQYAFKNGKNVYASIVKLENGVSRRYVVVVVDKHGRVILIDPSTQHTSSHAILLNEFIKVMNQQKEEGSLIQFKISEDPIIYTGIQGADSSADNTGIYAFTYWAAFLNTDSFDAYQNVNGADSEEDRVLMSYDSLKVASVYSKREKVLPPLDRENPFEEDIRQWLRAELDGLN